METFSYGVHVIYRICLYVHLGPWASYQIRKIAGCACAGNAGNVFPATRFLRKKLVIDPGMHHGTCVTHVPWCMSGSLTRGGGENVPGIHGACANRNFAYLARGPWSYKILWIMYTNCTVSCFVALVWYKSLYLNPLVLRHWHQFGGGGQSCQCPSMWQWCLITVQQHETKHN